MILVIHVDTLHLLVFNFRLWPSLPSPSSSHLLQRSTVCKTALMRTYACIIPTLRQNNNMACLLTYSTDLQIEHAAEAKQAVSGSAYQEIEADVRVEINSPYLSAGLP